MNQIDTPLTAEVHDYVFHFNLSQPLPLTIDFGAGDSIATSEDGSVIEINFAPKESKVEPGVILPGEDCIIFRQHLTSIQHRVRQKEVMTPDQKFEFDQTVKQLAQA